ncbi:AFG1 family ATPase [Thiotrichales bacterium 19S9-12]|nr:AFG1 family ATPase [Thiotrichales bacterium 19S9-11]MCF6811343.1 AFG1 family ATPase [Thiotrichales bacterium 19S9-12]
MNLLEQYKKEIKIKKYQEDSQQLEVVKALSQLQQQLLAVRKSQNDKRLFRWLPKKKNYRLALIRGIYIWGSVGRGKTFLMDLFYNSLDITDKKRMHFNHFMQMVHKRLRIFRGKKSPLDLLADEIASSIRLICFDEFFVEDIADAMILGGLFRKLFDRGLVLVATSNVEPRCLYLGGLQRELFLPAIDSLIAHVDIFNLDSGVDYRWSNIIEKSRYFDGLSKEKTLKTMDEVFKSFCKGDYLESQSLLMEGREINAIRLSDEVAWFTFESICGYGRGVQDYIEMAAKYRAVLISEVPILTDDLKDETRRFIALVDEFYDSRVILVLSAKVAMKELYQGKYFTFEFQRTLSRLNEMQTEDYLHQSLAFDKSSRHEMKASS